MSHRYCYWSVVNRGYADMMKSTVQSARRAGVFKDFHIWTDRPIAGARCHSARNVDLSYYLFKIHFLRDAVKALNYDYFVWLDADTYFVRNPGDVLRVLQGSPVHATLEADAAAPNNRRPDWWGCPLSKYAKLMRFKGVNSNSIFNVNAGFWIVHHDVIDTFCDLALDFWHFCKHFGWEFTEEPPLAYAMHMLCGNPYRHTIGQTSDLWASDWLGCYFDSLPDGRPWMFEDYFSGERCLVNPAIVHAMRCKDALIADGLGKTSGPKKISKRKK
ncbi:MAG: hypothetical protein ACYDH9_05660 [Limisphaerales bacterium]